MFSPENGFPKQVQARLNELMSWKQGLKDIYNSSKFYDIEIECNNDVFRAHKLVLCARNAVFVQLIEVEEKSGIPILTKTGSYMSRIKINADPQALKKFIEYLYTWDLKKEDVTLELLRIADMFDDMAFKEICLDQLSRQIDENNAVEILISALKNQLTTLENAASSFIALNYDKMKKREDFNRIVETKEVVLTLMDAMSSITKRNREAVQETVSAVLLTSDGIDLGKNIKELKKCTKLSLKAINGVTLPESIEPLCRLTQLVHLTLLSVKELGRKDVHLFKNLVNLKVLELGECCDLPDDFGTDVILKLTKLERLRLEKGQGGCHTFNILEGVSQSPSLTQLELVNFDIKKGFDVWLAKCTNIKQLLIIPTYVSQWATSNHMVLGGVTQLKETLTKFIWGITLELFRVTALFVDQCPELKKRIKGDAIPVLKPIPCVELIEDILKESEKIADLMQLEQRNCDTERNFEKPPDVDILKLLQLVKLLTLALPTTKVRILKIPFHATWHQSLLDSALE